MDISEIFGKAWKITWKYKILWLFGFLAGCGATRGGGNSGNQSRYSFDTNDLNQQPSIEQSFPWLKGVTDWVEKFFNGPQTVLNITVMIIVLLMLALLFLCIRTLGETGLVYGSAQADAGTAKLSFGLLFGESEHYFWRALGLKILVSLLSLILVLLVFLPMVFLIIPVVAASGQTNMENLLAGSMLIYICGFCCLGMPLILIISWALDIIFRQGMAAIVCDDLGIGAAFGRGWKILFAHFWRLIAMSLILWVITSIVLFVAQIPLFLTLIPLIAGVMSQSANGIGGGIAVMIALICLYTPVLIFLQSVIYSYLGTFWTLVYRRTTGKASLDVLPPVGAAPLMPPAPSAYGQ